MKTWIVSKMGIRIVGLVCFLLSLDLAFSQLGKISVRHFYHSTPALNTSFMHFKKQQLWTSLHRSAPLSFAV